MNKDLQSRIPAAVLYVLGIAICTFLGKIPSIILLVFFLGLSLSEFLSAQKLSKKVTIGSICISLIFVFLIIHDQLRSHILIPIIALTCLLIIYNIMFLISKKRNFIFSMNTHFAAFGYVMLPFIIAIGMITQFEFFPRILLGVFIILWLNDAGAYFSGRAFGKNKLFPSISPKKTWEGLIGGGIIGVLLSLLLYDILQVLSVQSWLIISLIVWVFGSIGDLVESSWKRSLKIKDSGHLMGGHGGFLDRLDSFIYAIPMVSLYIFITQ